jgi:hypothetical protein
VLSELGLAGAGQPVEAQRAGRMLAERREDLLGAEAAGEVEVRQRICRDRAARFSWEVLDDGTWTLIEGAGEFNLGTKRTAGI